MTYRTFFSRLILIALASCVAVSLANAQAISMPMADHVPADAVAYLGWAGADSQSAAYKASELSAFLDHSNLPEVARKYVPKLWDQLAGAGADPKATAALQKVLPLLWRHPVAVYASNVTINPDGSPNADIAVICDAGDDAAGLRSAIESMSAGEPHPQISTDGSIVKLVLNGTRNSDVGGTLATDPRFIATMKKLQGTPSIAVYMDGATILTKANESAEKDPNAGEIWPKVRDALGIGNVKSFAMTCGFEGGNWVTSVSLEAPGPRTGLLAAIEPKPIDPVLLARIPDSAGSVAVYNFDAAKVFDTIGEAMAASKDSDTLFHQIAGAATVVLGRNLRQQILGPMGSQWVLYSDSKSHSLVVMNHPTDADAADDSTVSVVFGLVNLANAQIPGAAAQPVANADQKRVKGVNLTSAVTKIASPTFATKDKILYFGLSADSVVNAATAVATPQASDLMHTADFLAAVKNLGIGQFASFDYCDLPKTAPAAYGNFGLANDQVRQVLGMFNVELPKIELPPVDQVSRLTPSLSVAWSDADGMYSKSICPFPGASQLLGDPQQSMVTLSTVSASVAVLAPAFHKAREAARMQQMMSNERQIGLALIIYANEHGGNLPPDLGSVVVYAGKNVKIFLKPGSKTTVPDNIATGTDDQAAAWVNDHAEYVLLQAGKRLNQIGNSSRVPIIVPTDAEQETTSVPVGFCDGHCETCKPERVKHLLHPDEAAEP